MGEVESGMGRDSSRVGVCPVIGGEDTMGVDDTIMGLWASPWHLAAFVACPAETHAWFCRDHWFVNSDYI